MKNLIALISILFLAACGGNETSLEALIEANDFEALKAKRSEILNQLKANEGEIARIDKALKGEKQEKKLPLVSVYSIEKQAFNHYVELQGSVETDQNIVVYAEIQGTLIDFKVKMGDLVQKGQTVAIIDDGGMSAQLEQVKQRAELSKTTYEKRKRLWEKNVGSEIDYLQAETQFLADQEAVKQMERQVAKATVRAPFTGQIDETIADEGQLVVPGQSALFRIVNLKDMYIHADVPEKYLGKIEKGKKVLIDLPVLDTTVESKISNVSNYLNPNNRTFKIEIDVPNASGKIKPNLTARLQVNDYINENAILIPQSIISEDSEGSQYIYTTKEIADSPNPIVQKEFITTGKKKGDYIEVLSGLKVGDSVIKDGARLVKDQQQVQIIK
ncbi:MAG: efflux RND transporter periplasmic adaptor subunit [Vicingaceae bacterium]